MGDDVSRLLARGGRILGLAAVAHSCGPGNAATRWYVLSPETRAAAGKIVDVLEGGVDRRALSAALAAALGSGPATSCPGWAEPLVERPELIEKIGGLVEVNPEIARSEGEVPDDRLMGLAALGMALCRSIDGVTALADRLPEEDGATLVRLSRFAQAVALPNEPSAVRARAREVIAGG
jgi:hypothetical protein